MTGDSVPGSDPDTKPDVSVITVCFQDLAGLRRTYESVASQEETDLEWIVIDGGSGDGTREWLDSLEDGRCRWVSEPDRGIYDAMNKGLARARGGLVVFMNAGDAFAAPRTTLNVVADFRRRRWRWAYGGSRFVDANGAIEGVMFPAPFRLSDLRLGIRALPHQASYFSRDLLDEVGQHRLDLPIAADQEFMLRAALVAAPEVLGEIQSECLTGGVSYGGRPDRFVWEARRMRVLNGVVVGGNSMIDAFATLLLAVEKWTRYLASKSVRGNAAR